MRTFFPCAVLLAAAGCSSQPASEPAKPTVVIDDKVLKEEPLRRYQLTGQVQRLDAKDRIATIKHQAIGDWMGAMTMDFPVKDGSDFGKLKEGAPVIATVFVQGLQYWVGEVREGAAAK